MASSKSVHRVEIPADMHAALDTLAMSYGCTAQSLVRAALTHYLQLCCRIPGHREVLLPLARREMSVTDRAGWAAYQDSVFDARTAGTVVGAAAPGREESTVVNPA